MQDPWITKFLKAEALPQEDLFEGLINLRAFKTQMTFQKAVLSYISSQELCKYEEEKLKQIFDVIDKDKNGYISMDELIQGYIMMFPNSPEIAKKVARHVMARVDLNQNKMIDYNEFLMANLTTENGLTESKLKKAFDFFDIVSFNLIHRITMER